MNQKDLKVGDIVYNSRLLGSLDVLEVESVYKDKKYSHISARSLSTGESKSYYDEYSYLVRINNICEHLRKYGLVETATKIINRNDCGIATSVAIYRTMRGLIALFSLDHCDRSEEWKEKISGKMWKFQDYSFRDTQYKIREARSFRKSDRMYNGDVFWAVIQPNGERQEWTKELETCLRRIGKFPIDEEFFKEYFKTPDLDK